MKYLRLLRLPDQYIQFAAGIAAGMLLGSREPRILWWAVATIFLAIPAYMVNELVDRKDTDRYSWNPIHKKLQSDTYSIPIVGALFALSTAVGLLMSVLLGYEWFGLAMFVIGILYSLPPVRLKGRFGLDIAAQLSFLWIVPFLAPVWGRLSTETILLFVIISSLIISAAVFPYQLADFEADRRAGLRNTHVTLGKRASIWLGILWGVVGMALYSIYGMYAWAPWTVPAVLVVPVALWVYVRALTRHNAGEQARGMQWFVRIFQPLSRVFAAALLIAWFFQ